MSAQKNVPKKQKVKSLTLTCLFAKRKFNGTQKISVLTTPTIKDVERQFSFLILPFTKLRNTFTPNSLHKLMQLISTEPCPYDLDMAKVDGAKLFIFPVT